MLNDAERINPEVWDAEDLADFDGVEKGGKYRAQVYPSFVVLIVESRCLDTMGFAPAMAQGRIDTRLTPGFQESRTTAIGDNDSGWQRYLLAGRLLPMARLAKLASLMSQCTGFPQSGNYVPCLA